jgi:flagellin-like hook-associated protein FlgL
MPLSINTNVASLTAQRAMLNSNAALETSLSVFRQASALTLLLTMLLVLRLARTLSHALVV